MGDPIIASESAMGLDHMTRKAILCSHRWAKRREDRIEFSGDNRLRQVLVHSSGETLIAIALHRVGRQRDDS